MGNRILLRNTHTHRRNIMQNKNAYEIRTEVLAMAKDLITDRFHTQRNNWEASQDRHPETGQILSIEDAPLYPTSAEILAEAKALYAFVDAGK